MAQGFLKLWRQSNGVYRGEFWTSNSNGELIACVETGDIINLFDWVSDYLSCTFKGESNGPC